MILLPKAAFEFVELDRNSGDCLSMRRLWKPSRVESAPEFVELAEDCPADFVGVA
jgi:hypothetical protein